MASHKTYYFVDVHLISKQIITHGESVEATHTGDTGDPVVHRMFIPKGQYNKLVEKLSQFER